MRILATTNRGLGYPFVIGQLVAAVTAMTFNFFLNNLLTYRDRRLVGFWTCDPDFTSHDLPATLGVGRQSPPLRDHRSLLIDAESGESVWRRRGGVNWTERFSMLRTSFFH
jgi:hypothetical protein